MGRPVRRSAQDVAASHRTPRSRVLVSGFAAGAVVVVIVVVVVVVAVVVVAMELVLVVLVVLVLVLVGWWWQLWRWLSWPCEWSFSRSPLQVLR